MNFVIVAVAAGPIGQRAALNETRAEAAIHSAAAGSQPGHASAGTSSCRKRSREESAQDFS